MKSTIKQIKITYLWRYLLPLVFIIGSAATVALFFVKYSKEKNCLHIWIAVHIMAMVAQVLFWHHAAELEAEARFEYESRERERARQGGYKIDERNLD